ncbi:MAG: hypothetical protein M4579_007185, partial [Chaenotheca gracillima]
AEVSAPDTFALSISISIQSSARRGEGTVGTPSRHNRQARLPFEWEARRVQIAFGLEQV